ncbi:hypothetical protein HAX54_004612, partial [Datura stramonium]|nr:hypothetical protein [Datura stramonium]
DRVFQLSPGSNMCGFSRGDDPWLLHKIPASVLAAENLQRWLKEKEEKLRCEKLESSLAFIREGRQLLGLLDEGEVGTRGDAEEEE